jgi:hypothetical protein
MFSIIEHIEYLIACYDCVTVPGWGAFIANDNPAKYHQEDLSMQRPQRSIGFNSGLSHNDRLLANSIMRREGMSFDDAMRVIDDAVISFRQQLAKGAEVSMGRLGYFRPSGKNAEFVPFLHDNACDRFFGLTDLEILTVQALEQKEKNAASTPNVLQGKNLFSRKAARIAASIAVLIGLGIMLTTPIIADREGHNLASMTPTVTAPQPQQLGMTVKEGIAPQEIEAVETNPAFGGVGNTSGKYYMVIATLRNQHELDAFKKKYSDLVPYMKLLSYKGLTCVYIARSDDYNQLMSLRGKLPERLRDIWIYS